MRALDNSVVRSVRGRSQRGSASSSCSSRCCCSRTARRSTPREEEASERNHLLVARSGREPGLTLERAGRPTPLAAWAAELFDSMQGLSEILDARRTDRPYAAALREQLVKLEDAGRTPSARVLAELEQRDESFEDFSLRISRAHRAYVLDRSGPRPRACASSRRRSRNPAMRWPRSSPASAAASRTIWQPTWPTRILPSASCRRHATAPILQGKGGTNSRGLSMPRRFAVS